MIKELTLEKVEIQTDGEHRLVLYNDPVNTFDYVIKSLVDVCEHDPEQAAQCTLIIHNRGKYAVLHGPKDDLNPRCTALLDRGLTAEIV